MQCRSTKLLHFRFLSTNVDPKSPICITKDGLEKLQQTLDNYLRKHTVAINSKRLGELREIFSSEQLKYKNEGNEIFSQLYQDFDQACQLLQNANTYETAANVAVMTSSIILAPTLIFGAFSVLCAAFNSTRPLTMDQFALLIAISCGLTVTSFAIKKTSENTFDANFARLITTKLNLDKHIDKMNESVVANKI